MRKSRPHLVSEAKKSIQFKVFDCYDELMFVQDHLSK